MATSVKYISDTGNAYIDSLLGHNVVYADTTISYYQRNTNAEHYIDWTSFQDSALTRVLWDFEHISKLDFVSYYPYDGGVANTDIDIAIVDPSKDTSFDWRGVGGYAYIPNENTSDEKYNDVRFREDSLKSVEEGSYGYYTLLHEIGHALGLSHPHDNGSFPGVSSAYDAGDYGLNDSRYTVMSYISKSVYRPSSLMVFDMAAIQIAYGEDAFLNYFNEYNLEDVLYKSYKTLWDTGGEDLIYYDGSKNVVIDLRPADLNSNSKQAGGYFSGLYDGDAYDDKGSELLGGYYIAGDAVEGGYETIIEMARGGSGDDLIHGNDARNWLWGSAGNDILHGYNGWDYLYGGAGDDILYGGNDRDNLYGNEGNDILYGGKGLDTLSGHEGNDILYGEQDNDNLSGDAGNDKLYGGGGDDTLYGGEGRDVLFGGKGDDRLYGNEGNDRVYGGEGQDTLSGGKGTDRLYGGEGNDWYYFYKDSETDYIYEENTVDSDILFLQFYKDSSFKAYFADGDNDTKKDDLVFDFGNNSQVYIIDYALGYEVEKINFWGESIDVSDYLVQNNIFV